MKHHEDGVQIPISTNLNEGLTCDSKLLRQTNKMTEMLSKLTTETFEEITIKMYMGVMPSVDALTVLLDH